MSVCVCVMRFTLVKCFCFWSYYYGLFNCYLHMNTGLLGEGFCFSFTSYILLRHVSLRSLWIVVWNACMRVSYSQAFSAIYFELFPSYFASSSYFFSILPTLYYIVHPTNLLYNKITVCLASANRSKHFLSLFFYLSLLHRLFLLLLLFRQFCVCMNATTRCKYTISWVHIHYLKSSNALVKIGSMLSILNGNTR